MNFQNPQLIGDCCLVPDARVQIRTQEATLEIMVQSVTAPWFTGIIQRVIPFEDVAQLERFEKDTLVIGSFFSGYFWLEAMEQEKPGISVPRFF